MNVWKKCGTMFFFVTLDVNFYPLKEGRIVYRWWADYEHDTLK